MTQTITTDLVEAYSQCPRKAFLLMAGEPNLGPHEYARMIEEQTAANRQVHWASLHKTGEHPIVGAATDLSTGPKVIADAEIAIDGLQARCDFLLKVDEKSRFGRFAYEPVKAIGMCHASPSDVLGLAYQGFVLGEVQSRLPISGTLVLFGNRSTKVKLTAKYKKVRQIVETLRNWTKASASDVPPIVLNKHCPSCPFRQVCLHKAEKEENLSLLDRMTPKLIRKYQDKGIFTVRQLSYIYKPRRSRKKAKRQVRHSLELQALAIRTGKIHVEHLPELPRGPVELFLDLEGIPDRDTQYLAGLLVCRGSDAEYESFWADKEKDEATMWSALVDRLKAFPHAPIFHYGSYEKKALTTLAKRYGKGNELEDRLVNVAFFVYGRVYFPVRSNGLKSLGGFLGASWTDPLASGLQSLVWRRRWETTGAEEHKQSLLQYNREDCEALLLLFRRLDRITRDAKTDPEVEFAHRAKRCATEIGQTVHEQFERILQSAHADSDGTSIRIRDRGAEGTTGARAKGARKGHLAYQRIIPPKANTIISVQPKRTCNKCHSALVQDQQQLAEKTVVDLVFTRNGCRKTVRRYEGKRGYCQTCQRHYNPPALSRLHNKLFGHAFQAWAVYQRVVLRLPYHIISQVSEHLFHVGLSNSSGVNFLRYLANYYSATETANLHAILKSNFVHVDETKISIQGADHYVWVFTDGHHVIFRMTETREANVVREILAGYQGVLVSDFYPGYDGIPCRQQKCLVHLIRDINDDLWKAPFDKELEAFAMEVQTLLVPILKAVDQHGLKARNLRKYEKDVGRFYAKNITEREYTSEAVGTYQKRFDRYRESLFTFLMQNGIPWENNMAERALRQLAVQRKISGSFFKQSAGHYLLLLGISQTCRFQGKSFLKFMLSKETDLDSFRRMRPIRYSYAVTKQKECSSVGAEEESCAPKCSIDEGDPGPQQC